MYHFSFRFAFQEVTAQSHVAETQQREIRPGIGVGTTRWVTRTTHLVRDMRGQFRGWPRQAHSPKERNRGRARGSSLQELICHWNTRHQCLQ